MKKFLIILIALPLYFSCSSTANLGRETLKAEMIKDRQFHFQVQSALPTGGRLISLTPDFDVRLQGDSLISYLPYYGKTYAATGMRTESPLNFRTNKFTYEVVPSKIGWDITIQPQDKREVETYLFKISTTGSATLFVTLNNSQPISFNGSVSTP